DPLHLARVPDDDGARAVLALRDDAFEGAVFQRMVLRAHGEALDGGVVARALRHRPAEQHAVVLEAEIVVKAGGGVLLHHEHAAGALQLAAGRFARLLEVALLVVLGERLSCGALGGFLSGFARHALLLRPLRRRLGRRLGAWRGPRLFGGRPALGRRRLLLVVIGRAPLAARGRRLRRQRLLQRIDQRDDIVAIGRGG